MARAVVATVVLPTLSLSLSSSKFHSRNDLLNLQDVEDWACSSDSDFRISNFVLGYDDDLEKLAVGNWKKLTMEPEVATTTSGIEITYEAWDVKYNGDSFASFDWPTELGADRASSDESSTVLWETDQYVTPLGNCVNDLVANGSVSLDLSVTYSTEYGSGVMEKKLLCNSTKFEDAATQAATRVYLECQASLTIEKWASSSCSDFRFSNFVLGYDDDLKKLAVGNWKKLTMEPEVLTTSSGTEINYEAWDVKYNGDSFATFDWPAELGANVNPSSTVLWETDQYMIALGNCVNDLVANGKVSLDLSVTYSTVYGSGVMEKNLLCNSTKWEDATTQAATRVYLECQAATIDSEVANLLENHERKAIVRKSMQLGVDSQGAVSKFTDN